MRVNIPFQAEFGRCMLSGEKTMTTRTKKYGSEGEGFTAFGCRFIFQRVFKTTLVDVAVNWYQEEGFNNPEDFILVWNKLHPRKKYRPLQEVWVHCFVRETELVDSLAHRFLKGG